MIMGYLLKSHVLAQTFLYFFSRINQIKDLNNQMIDLNNQIIYWNNQITDLDNQIIH